MQHDPRFADALSYCSELGEVCAIALKLPRTRADWCAKRAAVADTATEELISRYPLRFARDSPLEQAGFEL